MTEKLRIRARCACGATAILPLPPEEARGWACEACRSQTSLFDAPAAELPEERKLARASDPSTSKAAAERVVRSGRQASQKDRVLTALRDRPGSTSGELAAALGGDRYIASRRLPDLERDGLVARGASRECRANGGAAVTWFPTLEGLNR